MFNYKWSLKDYPAPSNLNVFGTFICGGGSTMGYKLAGFNHLGGVEIDPEMAKIYKKNHNPSHLFICDIRDFIHKDNLPNDLLNLDIMDGSPPCSSFSLAGQREAGWTKKKVFREGQSDQILDDLFFEYIRLGKKLQPKIMIAENVTGLVKGNAKAYVKQINAAFDDAGYITQLFVLNAASMGVPQKRERVFFVARRKELKLKNLILRFNKELIPFKNIKDATPVSSRLFTDYDNNIWANKRPTDKHYGDVNLRLKGTESSFNSKFIKDTDVCNTITSTAGAKMVLFSEPRFMTNSEIIKAQTFPHDYDFLDADPKYVCGMSVPPVMMAHIANQIKIQWLNNGG
jgi:DNA (cytosine-5)-methyltransferase 1